jgi:hypothetical protein
MDLYCQHCGEPWDACLDDLDRDEQRLFRRGQGCPACDFGAKPPTNPAAARMTRLLAELCGSDTDFLASALDDARTLGLLDEEDAP